MATKKTSKVAEFMKEFSESFAEQKETKLKNSVWNLMSKLKDVEQSLADVEVQKELLLEKKAQIQEDLEALDN